jgi:hypothetical protein
MTDTLALSVLAVVAGSVGATPARRRAPREVAVGDRVLALFCAFVLPVVTRFVFAGVGQHRGARFLFVAVALTAAALVADRAASRASSAPSSPGCAQPPRSRAAAGSWSRSSSSAASC